MSKSKLRYLVKRGAEVGIELTPHVHEDGKFVASKTRFERDYVQIADESDLINWLKAGYKIRMSNQGSRRHRAPSLICKDSIELPAD